jgi:hypothetical protein
MIPVTQTEDGYRRATSTLELLTAEDDGEQAYVASLLDPSYDDAYRARFGLFLAVEFELPDGYQTTSEERFELIEGVVKQVYDVEEVPPSPILTDREKAEQLLGFVGLTVEQFKAVLEAAE